MGARSGYWPAAVAEDMLDTLATKQDTLLGKIETLLGRLPAALAAGRLTVEVGNPAPAPPSDYFSRDVLALPEPTTLRMPAALRGIRLTAERWTLVQFDAGDPMLLAPGESLALPDQQAATLTYRATDVFNIGRLSLLGRR